MGSEVKVEKKSLVKRLMGNDVFALLYMCLIVIGFFILALRVTGLFEEITLMKLVLFVAIWDLPSRGIMHMTLRESFETTKLGRLIYKSFKKAGNPEHVIYRGYVSICCSCLIVTVFAWMLIIFNPLEKL